MGIGEAAFTVFMISLQGKHREILQREGIRNWFFWTVDSLEEYVAAHTDGNEHAHSRNLPNLPEDLSEEETAELNRMLIELKEAAGYQEYTNFPSPPCTKIGGHQKAFVYYKIVADERLFIQPHVK